MPVPNTVLSSTISRSVEVPNSVSLFSAGANTSTTLRDFVGGDGKPGYFIQELNVYGRGGEACPACGNPIHKIRTAGRGTHYCPTCQI